jgi:hypothetical protein
MQLKRSSDSWDRLHARECSLLIWLHRNGIQDSRLVALRLVALRTAKAICSSKGEVQVDRGQELLDNWQRWAPQWPLVMDDLEQSLQVMRSLVERLVQEKSLRQLIMSCGRPVGQPESEQRIRLSLGLSADTPVGDYETRIAVVSALLTPLRQSVGSCFATAPCILVQRQEPAMLLDDLRALIELGRLERIVQGQSAIVPIALRWAGGLVRRPVGPKASRLAQSPGFLGGAFAALGKERSFVRVSQQVKQLMRLLPARAQRSSLPQPEMPSEPLAAWSIHDVYERLIAAALDLPWPLPEPPAEGSGLLLSASSARLLRKREQWEEGVRAASEAFSALEHHPLLKTWEYTVASFVEARPAMAAHNLWTSLGLASQDPRSIGGALIAQLQPALDSVNQDMEQAVGLANQCVSRVKSVQSRSTRLKDARDAEWASAEARSAQRDYDYAQGRLTQLEDEAQQLAEFPKFFANVVERLMPRYFQEAYDPALVGQVASVYDDAAAGFRLVAKGGVDFVPAWRWIEDASQYRLCMREFLDRVFFECRDVEQTRYIGAEVNRLSQSFSLILDEPDFQLAALERLAETHQRALPKDPLHHLDKVTYKPWAYESGGTLLGLVQHYFGLTELPSVEQKRCERAIDLVAFLVDQLRLLPDHQLKLLKGPWGDLLGFSPTHAFTILAGAKDLQLCIEQEIYSYTYLQTTWMDPQEAFWRGTTVQSGPVLDRVLERWLADLPSSIQPVASLAAMGLPSSLSAADLVELVSRGFPDSMRSRIPIDVIIARLQGYLWEELPLLPPATSLDRLATAFPELARQTLEIAVESLEDFASGAAGRRLAVQLACGERGLPLDAATIVARLRQQGLMAPAPMIWADTNWPFFQFALIWSPQDHSPALWRVSPLGDRGLPMAEWSQYLAPGNEQPWGWLNHPTDYRNRLTSPWMVGHRGGLLS